VLNWERDPKTGEGEVVFVVPKGLPLGAHPLKLVNSVGDVSSEFSIISP
jgi:hypothetical protein